MKVCRLYYKLHCHILCGVKDYPTCPFCTQPPSCQRYHTRARVLHMEKHVYSTLAKTLYKKGKKETKTTHTKKQQTKIHI